ncbi:MAG: hypothetical protein WC986_13685 [Elusimicrobiota bacterium]|jgi:hypothetical protein
MSDEEQIGRAVCAEALMDESSRWAIWGVCFLFLLGSVAGACELLGVLR